MLFSWENDFFPKLAMKNMTFPIIVPLSASPGRGEGVRRHLG